MAAERLFKILSAGVLVLGLGTTLAFASADDAIKGRQACMKGHGKMMGELAAIFKGEKPYDAAAVQASLAANDAACADWDKWWGEDSKKGETAETWAKPEIWSDPAGFKAAGENFYAKYVAFKATTDEASFKAAFPELGNGCKGCHDKFRRPKE
ncbi:MAG: c-type cytochrome [Methylocella sp.]